jgi:hypothetical protein
MAQSTPQRRIIQNSVVHPGSRCWHWTGATDKDGYGVLSLSSPHRSCRASRFSYQVFKGPIPDGLLVLHTCDVTGCVNPDHLFIGTYTDNVLDCKNKNRLADTKGERHGRAKLTDEQVRQIRQWKGTQGSAARYFGVCQQTISNIVIRRGWRHVT